MALCSPRHRVHCSPDHAALVGGYRDARDARDALRETGEYMQMEDDDFAAAHPPVLFKEWLIGHAGRNRPPDPLPSEGDSTTPNEWSDW